MKIVWRFLHGVSGCVGLILEASNWVRDQGIYCVFALIARSRDPGKIITSILTAEYIGMLSSSFACYVRLKFMYAPGKSGM